MAHIRHRPYGSAGINSCSYGYDQERTGSHVTNTTPSVCHKNQVHVLANGKIQRSGGKELALELEKNGYADFAEAAA